jgi:hypothetical protein
MKDSWDAETSIENREAVDPVVISLEETSEGGGGGSSSDAPATGVEGSGYPEVCMVRSRLEEKGYLLNEEHKIKEM